MIKLQTYPLNKLLLTNEILESYITNFWNDIFTSIKDRKHLMLMVKVEFNESEVGYRTLGDLRRVNYSDKELFIEYLTLRLGLLNESYVSHPISKITFSYIIKDGLATDNRRLLQDLTTKTSTTHRFNNLNLPISMVPSEYGAVAGTTNFETFIRYFVTNNNKVFQIDVSLDGLTNTVTMLGAVGLKWIDTIISEGIFMREIGKSVIYFMGGEKVLRKKLLNAKPFTKLATDKTLNKNFVTMDIETINLENKITPYLICAYNGTDYLTSYGELINGIVDQQALFTSFINQLLTFFNKGGNTLTVYAHNFAKFDGIFLFNQLLQFGIVIPKVRDGKIISLKLKLNISGYKNKTIIFNDSMLLLPQALRKLCESFGIESSKGYFPFKLSNIFYTGMLPKFENWTGISLTQYELLLKEYTGVEWNFKEEAIKYCKLDCQVLHQILIKFNELIFSNFKVNIQGSLTLPSLAMRIYRALFMPENTIYQLL